MTKRSLVLVLGLVAAFTVSACGSSDSGPTDYSSNFVGTWNGSSVVVVDGSPVNSPNAFTHIFANGVNSIVVKDVCGDGSGPVGTVTSGTNFTMAGMSCPPVSIPECASVNFTLAAGGTGTLSGTSLVINVAGALAGCGQTFPLTFTFTGTRTSTNPAGLRADDGGTVVFDAPVSVWESVQASAAGLF